MSSKSNVNTDHYKTAGRGRQGEGLVPEVHKRSFARARARARVSEEAFFPGARSEAARAIRQGGIERLVGLRRPRKPRGLSAKQLMERRIRLRHARGSQGREEAGL